MYAMVTLDLANADGNQRTMFGDKMAAVKWVKLPDVSTSWRANFGEASEAVALDVTRREIADAVRHAGIKSVKVWVQFGPNAPQQPAIGI